MNPRRLLMLAAAVALMSAARPAQAQFGGYGCSGGWGFGGWDVGRLYSVLAQNVPHFAAFPPVYYSYPVPRTYGYSPFAYPPGVMTPEVEFVEPLAMTNPYFQGDATAAPPAAKVDQVTEAPAPAVILNPYFRGDAPALATR
ncbi:MAG TPA: hypothetical protein PKC18_17265 [Lacipirellulaceae bacterium]|nr:hypothetical protein [Lacipirellulaceae bacterium]